MRDEIEPEPSSQRSLSFAFPDELAGLIPETRMIKLAIAITPNRINVLIVVAQAR
jgi:hypothetical protein